MLRKPARWAERVPKCRNLQERQHLAPVPDLELLLVGGPTVRPNGEALQVPCRHLDKPSPSDTVTLKLDSKARLHIALQSSHLCVQPLLHCCY